ncbi:MAG: DEAD/DEAH box helicase [Acidimicrobiia bacterium]
MLVPTPHDALTRVSSDRPDLYRWQLDALVSWLQCGRRGVIEAVTGSGKTDVAIAAAGDAIRRGRFVLVLVPSRVLMEQWHGRLSAALPGVRVGRLGDSGRDQPESCEVLVATRHSAASYRPLPPEGGEGLLIVDECHGMGGTILRRALLPQYTERLGLTATLERTDDAVTELLLPFFGGICHRYGFEQAIADGVCAVPRVALVGVELSAEERTEYVGTEQQLVQARSHLRSIRGVPLEPFGAFIAAVAHLAEHDAGADGRAARDYLDAFSKRRQIVAQSSGKYELLGRFAPAITSAHGALLFTETVRAANHAINRLDPLVAIELITGSTARRQRRDILDDLRAGRLDAVAAPRVLDEGIDVPDANLGIVMSASRTRRQMIQRMGRILRRKQPGVAARFVIMFAKDTLEDPATRLERDGFLDEIERISEATGTFDIEHFDGLDAFLDQPGPAVVPQPERLDRYHDMVLSVSDADRHDPDRTNDHVVEMLTERMSVEGLYAYMSFARPSAPASELQQAVWRLLEPQLPEPGPDAAPYLELEIADLPEITKPKVEPRRLSTGQAPLEINAVDEGWQMSCTGCGQTTAAVRFRWQLLDETVACRCA